MNMSYRKAQSGFTLVEIAIVLVIIGLLLGGVLKGTELIENSKVKRAVSEINGVTAALYSYQDRYQRLPGDDGPLATLTGRGGSWSLVTTFGNNNGAIAATRANTFNGNGEGGVAFWSHLRAAGFISGDPAALALAAMPKNAFGGVIGVTTQAVGNPASPIAGKMVCLSQVPGKSAAALDTQLDDGNGNTGKMRATLGVSGANTVPGATALAAAYNETAEYTICVQM